ncbi:MAG: CpsD/CapB family tyrosine-protein kinase [Bacteroidales bacterium]
MLGFLIPGGIIILKDYFNDKITDLETIEKTTEYSVLGNLSHKKEDTENIVYYFPKSLVAETFRSIRTNFQFITGGEKVTTVLISSATQGEGKSFVSVNLATSFAMYKRKTVLVSFDLRRPNLYNLFNIKDKQGLSAYLSNNCNLEDIIYQTDVEMLDVIPAGYIPPNPSELIASEVTARLFEKLKGMYEYIIIDTPPAGLVTDAFLLVKYTNSNLFVVRHNYTREKMFESFVKNLKQKNIRNVNFIVNDITLKSRGYEYNYGYNYNYSYYS